MDEVEENVRTNGSVLTDGNTQLASLFYVDPRRFASDASDLDLIQGLSARVVEENMTVSAFESITDQTHRICRRRHPGAPGDADRHRSRQCRLWQGAGRGSRRLSAAARSTRPTCRKATSCASASSRRARTRRPRSCAPPSIRAAAHVFTMALDDKGNFVKGYEPPQLAAVATAFDDNGTPAITAGRDLPRVYDGVYRAALSYGMNSTMIAQIIKLLASNVDFQAQLKPTDSLEAFFSVADDSGKATDDSELLYVNAKFGDAETRFYRFQDPDDNSIDYYNEQGKSIRQFLLRNPVPNGTFRSGFGMRRHPILGFSRMHTGVDWAAPRGTPIIAAGNGTVEKAGWDSGGYGNQTLIRHANGYVSSYNHQSAIAKSVTRRHQGRPGPGDRLGRHDRPVDRTASALRADRQSNTSG